MGFCGNIYKRGRFHQIGGDVFYLTKGVRKHTERSLLHKGIDRRPDGIFAGRSVKGNKELRRTKRYYFNQRTHLY